MKQEFATPLEKRIRNRRAGKVFRERKKMNPKDRHEHKIKCRFFDKVLDILNNGDCWLWTGHKNSQGYGNFRMNGRLEKAHRASYMIHNDFRPIPNGMAVCHSCDVPSCVNPAHLFLGTAKDNMQDSLSKSRFISTARVAAQTRGEDRYNAKLTQETVKEILKLHSIGVPKAHLARKYGVSYSCVNNIILGKSWKHVTLTSL